MTERPARRPSEFARPPWFDSVLPATDEVLLAIALTSSRYAPRQHLQIVQSHVPHIVHHQLIGMTDMALSQGWLEADSHVRDSLCAAHRTAAHIEVALLQELLRIVRLEPEVVVLDGVPSAYLDYLDPSMRNWINVRVLVAPATAHELARALESTGEFSLQHGGVVRGDPAAFILRSANNWDLEVRTSLSATPISERRFLHLLQDLDEFEIGGTRLRCLPRSLRLVDAATRLARTTHPRLNQARDLVELTEQLHPDISGSLAMAEQAGCIAEALRGAAITERLLQVPLPWNRARAERAAITRLTTASRAFRARVRLANPRRLVHLRALRKQPACIGCGTPSLPELPPSTRHQDALGNGQSMQVGK